MILSLVLCIGYAVLILCYRSFWLQLKEVNISATLAKDDKKPFISIIIPARNEEMNIGPLLTSLCKQTYDQTLFEIIVVDDFSEDKTAVVVKSFSNDNVHYVSLKEMLGELPINSYKKKAIEIGISVAKGALIVTTDADCVADERWIETIADYYVMYSPDMIVMPVIMSKEKSFLQLFQQLDFMSLQGITGGVAAKGFHQMCNGANLAYTKAVFNRVGGFKDIDNIASGDDMLLMQKIAKDKTNKISYLKAKEVIIQTAPVESLSAFLQQRIRWAGKANQYLDKSLFPVLLMVYLFNCMLALLFILGCFDCRQINLICCSTSLSEFLGWLVLIKVLVELFFLYPVATFFGKRIILFFFPLMQPFHVLYTIAAGWLGKFGKYKWKERTVK
jgi:cellulose synthase/poly-beta-1,6-N-acetylglucosamine synthase-like glycosyltransferase